MCAKERKCSFNSGVVTLYWSDYWILQANKARSINIRSTSLRTAIMRKPCPSDYILQARRHIIRYVVCSVFVQGPGILSIACHTVKWGRWAGTKQMEHITNTTQSMRLNQMNKDSTPNHRNCLTNAVCVI